MVIFLDIIGFIINRVFFCLLFVYIGVGYDRELDVGCLKVIGRKGIKWLLNRRFCFNI